MFAVKLKDNNCLRNLVNFMTLSKFAILGHHNRAFKFFLQKRHEIASGVIKILQIQSFSSENAYGPVANFGRTGTGPRPDGYRSLIYSIY